ncbi:MAG: low-complexity tail membrane protein, partial [Cyanobium sp.]
LAPALLLWRQPADVWSLLLVQTPARGRRDLQRRLSALQDTLPLRLALALGAALLLVLLWRLDAAAALATALAPLPEAPRLVALLLSAPVLAVMLWQWQQAIQALWLLSRSTANLEVTAPLSPADHGQRRLSLGLPLLLPAPLQGPSEPSVAGGAAVAIEPEQAAEQGEGPELDQPVA